jgi:coproporphyrinogen III oxidase-like Fe-S oxidoreductase
MPAKSTAKKMSKQMGKLTFTRERQYYEVIREHLSRSYQASSAWCFSRNAGMIDEYIIDYDQYVGVGSGSFGYLDGTMYANTFSISQYIDRVNKGSSGITKSKTFNRKEQLRYYLMTKLFGLSLDKRNAEKIFGPSFLQELHWEIRALRLLGAIKDTGDQLVLTRRGMYYWVMMMREFLTGVNNLRDEMRGNIRVERQNRFLT